MLSCILFFLLEGCSQNQGDAHTWVDTSSSIIKTMKLNEQDTHQNWYDLKSITPYLSQVTESQYFFGAGSRVYAYENEEITEVMELDGYTFITGLKYNARTEELWISALKYKSDTQGAILCYRDSALVFEAKDLPAFDNIYFDAKNNVFFIHEEYAKRKDSVYILHTEYQYSRDAQEVVPVRDRMILSTETEGNLTAVAWCDYTEEYLAWSFKTDIHIDVVNERSDLVSQATITDAWAATPAMKLIQNDLYFSILANKPKNNDEQFKLYKMNLETKKTDEVEPGSWKDGEISKLLSEGNRLYVFGYDSQDSARLQIIEDNKATSYYQFDWEHRQDPQILTSDDTKIRAVTFDYDGGMHIVEIKRLL